VAGVLARVKPKRAETPERTLLATDDVARFCRVGQYFLGEPLAAVELVDI